MTTRAIDSPASRARADLSDRRAYVHYVASLREMVRKDDFIVGLARGRTVLDLGCIDHSADTALTLGDSWLHGRLRGVAERLVGVDVLPVDAEVLNARGYDIRIADVESLDLGDQFDLIVAGDLIEHLSNVGRFLESVSRHMHEESAFVVTTPNPFNVEQFTQGLFHNRIAVNPEHTAWIDPRVMHEIVSRSPLEIIDFAWIDTRFRLPLERGRVLPPIVNRFHDLVMRRRPVLRADYAVVLKLRPSSR